MESKTLIGGLIVVVALMLILSYGSPPVWCLLVHGRNICNYYEVMDALAKPDGPEFERVIGLCRGMSDVPKKDACFEIIAEHYYREEDASKVEAACNSIQEFEGVHSREECFNKVRA